MSIAAENLPLPRRDGILKKVTAPLPRRFFQKPTAAAMVFKKFFEFHCCDCI
jgi:hypothetical protein